MAEEKNPKPPEEIVLTRLLRLNATVQGIVTGLVFGLVIFIATNWLTLKGGRVVGPHLALLSQFFIGYRVTFVGSLIGFAHGFVALEDETLVTYLMTGEYSPQHDAGVRWNDPDIGVEWPVTDPIVSEKDRNLPHLSEIGVAAAKEATR